MKTMDSLKEYFGGSEQQIIDPKSSREYRFKYIIAYAVFLIIAGTVPWAIYFYKNAKIFGGLLETLYILTCLLVLWLIGKGKINFAKILIILVTFFWIFSVVLFCEGVGVKTINVNHFYFLALLCGVFLLHFDSNLILKYGLILSCIIGFVIVQYQLVDFYPLISVDSQTHELGRHFSLLLVYLLLACITQIFVRSILETEKALFFANNLQEKMLEKILPQNIATRLRSEGKGFIEEHKICTVLYADLVGFTKLSEKMGAKELVLFLNEIFGKFDDLTTQFGLQKIKTIGDAYIVASFSHDTDIDKHADSILELSRNFLKVIKNYEDVRIRIGINSGSMVEGVIGKNKFTYDLWGRAVSLASKMESNCIPGSIHITQNTYNLLKNEYHFKTRKIIDEEDQELVTYQIMCD